MYIRYLITSSMVHLHSSLLFLPDACYNTFSSFRSIPKNYLLSTERWFTASTCLATVIDLLSSSIQHSLLLQISNDSRHTPRELVANYKGKYLPQDCKSCGAGALILFSYLLIILFPSCLPFYIFGLCASHICINNFKCRLCHQDSKCYATSQKICFTFFQVKFKRNFILCFCP